MLVLRDTEPRLPGARGNPVHRRLRFVPGLLADARASIQTGNYPVRIGVTDWINCAAREGLDVTFATYNARVGGMTASGLSQTDAQIVRERAPFKDEFFARVAEYYREEYGPDSPQPDASDDGYVPEPNVAEVVFEDLLEEAGVDVRREYAVKDVTHAGNELRSVRLLPRESSDMGYGVPDREADPITVEADTFVDATYEGDLAATAGCASRVGCEVRHVYDEAHAGWIYTYRGARRAVLGCVWDEHRRGGRGLFATRPRTITKGSFVQIAEVADPIAPVVENGAEPLQHLPRLVVGVRGKVLHLVGIRYEVVELLGRAAAGEEVRGRSVEFVGASSSRRSRIAGPCAR